LAEALRNGPEAAAAAQQEEMMANDSGWWARWRAYRPSKATWFWSCVASAIATIVVGFAWGGWVTGGGAAQMTANAADNARTELAAQVCVTRFEHSPTAAVELASLKKTDEWQRGSFIEKGGWVTLPGMAAPVSGAGDLCAEKLMAAKLPVPKPLAKSAAKSKTAG
jgi:hypothetical protein